MNKPDSPPKKPDSPVRKPDAPAKAKPASLPSVLEPARLDPDEVWIEVAKVGRPHGIHGEVRLQAYHPESELWDRPPPLRGHLPGKPAFLLHIDEIRQGAGALLAKVRGVRDRETAALLTHALLSIAKRDLPQADEDEFYLHEVVGAIVYECETGQRAGVVTAVVESVQDLLEIRLDSGGTALIPVQADAIESIGTVPGRVDVRHVEDWRT